jgi:hypothetical protein
MRKEKAILSTHTKLYSENEWKKKEANYLCLFRGSLGL